MANAVQGVIDRLADHLQRSIVLNDPAIKMLYSSIHFGDEDDVRVRAMLQRGGDAKAVGHVLAQGVSGWTAPGVIPAKPEIGMKRRVCVPIRWRGELLGQLMVMDADTSLTPRELASVSEAAQEIAIALAAEGQVGLDSGPLEQAVADLISGEPTLRRRAIGEFAEDHVLDRFEHVAAIEVGLSALSTRPADDAHVAMALRAALSTPYKQSAGTGRALGAVFSGTAVLLLGGPIAPAESGMEAHAKRMLEQLRDLAAGHFECRAGVGGSVRGLELAYKSAAQARLARRAADTVLRRNVAAWSGLGPYGPLLQIPAHRLEDSLPDELHRLIDIEGEGDLVATVRAYLDHAGNGPAAAEQLHVHRTTLYYRLGRVSDLSGLDLSDGRTRLSLHLGLAMMDLIRAESTA